MIIEAEEHNHEIRLKLVEEISTLIIGQKAPDALAALLSSLMTLIVLNTKDMHSSLRLAGLCAGRLHCMVETYDDPVRRVIAEFDRTHEEVWQ